MQELFEEYGDFIIESVGSALFLVILCGVYLGAPIKTLILNFITSAVG